MRTRIVSTVPSRVPRKIRVLAGSIAACLGSLLAAPEAAAQLQWDPDGNGANATFGGAGSWNDTDLFWWNGTTNIAWPNIDPSATIAVFGGTGGLVTLEDPINVNGLTFNAGGYTIDDGGITANTLNLGGTTPTITVTNGADTAIITAILTGAANFSKAGAGTLSFEGTNANTFTGTLTASAGTLNLAKAGATAISGNLTIAGGTVLYFGNNQMADTAAVTISSGALNVLTYDDTVASLTLTGGAVNGNGGTLTLSSTATALSMRNVTISSHLALSGASGGGITFDSTGNGTGTISGNLDLGSVARVITVGNGTAATDLNFSGVVNGTQGFSKTGDGTLLLNGGAANTYTGTAVLNRGILSLGKTTGNAITGDLDVLPAGGASGNPVVELQASNQIADSANVTLRGVSGVGGAGFDLKGFNETITGLSIINNQGTGSVVVQTGGATGGGTLTLLGDVSVSGSSAASAVHPVLNITGNRIGGAGGAVTAANVGSLDLGGGIRAFNVSATANAAIGSRITNGGITKTGATILILENANNNYTGLTTVNGGTLRIATAGALPAGNDFRVFSGTLDFNNTSFTTPATGLVLGGGAASATSTIQTGTGTLTLAGDVSNDVTNNPGTATVTGKVDLGGASRVFNIADSTNTATEATISAVIAGSGLGITKTGNGTLLLSGVNTFSGSIAANGGVLALGAAHTSVSAITVNNGGSLSPRAANSIAVNPQINSGGTLLLDTAGADSTAFNNFFSSAVTGISVDGGTILANNANDRSLTNRVITAGAGGVTFNIAGSYPNFVEGAVTQLRLTGTTQVLTGSGPVVKTGGGRLQFQVANANYSGPITVNDGTLEVGGTALGNNSVTNTLTLNGGNVALSSGLAQVTTMAGGAISTNGSSQTVAAPITLQASTNSYTFLNNFWIDNPTGGTTAGWNMTLTGVVGGSGNLGVAVNRPGYDYNGGQLILQNTGNSISGNITVGKNLSLTSSPTSGAGSTIGSASVTLANGKLNLRDNGAGSNGTLTYGNNVTLTTATGIYAQGDIASASNVITVDRASGSNTGNTIELGTLTAVGAQILDFTGSSSYGVRFNGLTTIDSATTFNTTAGVLTLGGGLSGAGQSFTKTGAGTLRILGANDATYTLTGGTLEVPNEPASGRSLALPLGVGFGAGYAATQANLIDHVTLDSAGVVALGVDSTFNPDFTGFTGGLRLGGTGNATLTGTITPAGTVYLLGGGGGSLTLATQNVLTGARTLDVNVNGTAPGTIVLASSNDFTGATSVGGGMILRIASNASLGSNASVTLDGGTLQLTNGGDFTGLASRVLTAGAGGATLDTNGANAQLDTAIAGTGLFSKAGAGTLTLTNTSASFGGKTAVRGGMLSIAADTNLGAVPGAVVADQLTLNGGGILATATMTIPANRGITLGAGGATFEVPGTNNFTLSSIIAGGTNPITKEGTGTLTINASSTTGTVSVNNGNLDFSASGKLNSNITAAAGTNVRILGGTDAIGDTITITLNGNSTLSLSGGATETTGRIVGTGTVTRAVAGTHTLTLNSATNAQFDGVIQNGSGTIAITKNGTNTLTWTGANSYSGATAINTGSIILQGAAAALGNTAITVGDNSGADESLTLGTTSDVWTSGALNRLGDTGSITLNYTSATGVVYNGPAAGSSGNVETIGALSFSNGRNFFTINPGDNNEVQITTGSLTRSSQGFGLVRGANFGATGTGSTRLAVTNLSTFSGANGADGTTTKSIVPFATLDAASGGNGFLTAGVNGLRLLTAAEYDSTITGSTPLRNVSLAGGETVLSSPTINSIRVTGGTTSIGAGQSVRLQSGSILFSDAGAISGTGAIDAGASDAIITVVNSTAVDGTVNARIAANGGLTLTGSGGAHTVTLGGDNEIAGTVMLNGGLTLKLGSSKALNDNYPATVMIRSGGAVQLNGNDVTIRNLSTIAGGGTFTNGGASAATLTTYLTSAQTLVQGISNGSTGALNLIVAGGQTLSMTNNNSYTGFTELRGANATLSGASTGLINQSSAIAINGGFLRLTNNNTSAATNRILDTAPIAFNGGTLDFDNNASDASFSETVGDATLVSGANVLTVDKGQTSGTARSSVLTVNSLARSAGATLNVSSQNNGAAIFDLGTSGRSRLVFTTAPTLDDGIVGGWATIDSAASTREFLKYVVDADSGTTGNQPSATALVTADYTATLASGANPTQNVKVTASPAALTGATQINSLNIQQTSATSVDLGANTLRVESGGIIASGAFASNILNNGTVTAGTGAAGGDLIVHTVPAVSSGITWTNASDTVSLGNVPNGTPVIFTTVPGGLATGVTYYVVNSTATTFQVAAVPGGAVIPITSDGTTGAFSTLYANTVNATIADNGGAAVNLVKAGAGTLVLGTSNSYTGKTYLDGGILRIGADGSLGAVPASAVADSIVMSNASTLDITASMTLSANRGITVGSSAPILGNSVSNVVSIASGTAGNGKTLTYNGAITSLGTTEGSLQFKSNLGVTGGVDPGKFVGTLTALDINGSFRLDAGTVIVSKATNTIGRSLQVGADGSGSLTYSSTGGSLTVGKGINDVLDVGSGSVDMTAGGVTNVSALNLSALSSFTANVDQVRIANQNTTQKARATVTLATNNDITAGTQVLISTNSASGNVGENTSFIFGSGVNNITTKLFTVAGLKGDATATIAAGGIVNLKGFGANTLDLYVSRNNGSTGTISTGTFNGTGGTINASLNQLVIAEKSTASGGNGGATGTFTLGATNNNITANAVTIGSVTGNSSASTNATVGTLNVGGGTVVVNSDVTLGLWANNSTFTPTATGNLNITGGSFTVGGNITTTTGSTLATANLNVDGGALDMTAGNITVDSFTAKSGTLKNVAQIFGGDGTTPLALTKTTAGTLVLDGTNTYTGGTVVNAGTLIVNGSVTGTLTAAAGTTLGGDGSISGAVTLANGATLAPGNSPGSLDTGAFTFNGGTFAIDIASATSFDQVNVTGNVNLGGTIALTLDFSSYNPADLVDSFTLIANDSSDLIAFTGGFTFNGTPITLGSDFEAVSGSYTQAFQLNVNGGDGNDLVLNAVPEPASAMTLLAGSGVLLGLRRSRRREIV